MNRGFASIALVIALIVLVAGGVGYWVLTRQPAAVSITSSVEPPATQPVQQNSNTATQPTTSQATPTSPSTSADSANPQSCIGSLYSSDRAKYDFWKSKYANLHPEFAIRDAVSYCQLTDGTQFVSFSFSQTGPGSGESVGHFAGASIALFDKNNNLVRENNDLRAIGDGVPYIDSVANSKVRFRSLGKGAGTLTENFDERIDVYELQLSDFSFGSILSLYSQFRSQVDSRMALLHSSPEGPLKYIAWLETNSNKRVLLHIATLKTGDKTWSDAMGRSEVSCSYEGGAVSNVCLSKVLASIGTYDIGTTQASTNLSSSYNFSLGKIDNTSADLLITDSTRNSTFTVTLGLTQSRVISTADL